MKIVTFNVNGIRARMHQLQELVSNYKPDIIGLQEIKVADEQFPVEEVQSLGYEVTHFGQKGHYGVATLSKIKPCEVRKGLPHDEPDAQRRMLCTVFETHQGKLFVLNGYYPQGESRNHETKFPAKEKFYADLTRYLNEHFSSTDQVILMGDFNISPEDKDIGIGEDNRKRWLRTGKCSFLPEEREWLGTLKSFGLQDCFRKHYPDVTDQFSWFDYRSKGFEDSPKRGLRIDYILATPSIYSACTQSQILFDIRAMDKPSDHCPVMSEFSVS